MGFVSVGLGGQALETESVSCTSAPPLFSRKEVSKSEQGRSILQRQLSQALSSLDRVVGVRVLGIEDLHQWGVRR